MRRSGCYQNAGGHRAWLKLKPRQRNTGVWNGISFASGRIPIKSCELHARLQQSVVRGIHLRQNCMVGLQDSLVHDCLTALAARPTGQNERRTGFHSHDGSFKRTRTTPHSKWWRSDPSKSMSIPVPVTISKTCQVFTCGDRPDPMPKPNERLFADDSLVWTHQSRFWSYKCEAKHGR